MYIDALLDRQDEVAALNELVATLNAGHGATVLIEGVPGIGKTALLRCGRARAVAADVRVLLASGSEMDRHLAFSGLRQLFFDVLREGAELSGPAAAAAPALGLGESAQPPEPAAVAYALRWLLTGLAAAQPVVLVVDDLQWVDPASRQVLAHLVSRTQGAAVGFLFATRPEGADAVEFDQALRDSQCRVLRPAPLTTSAVERLVVEIVGDARVDRSFVDACWEATGGVPFLVTELLREVHAQGLACDADGASTVRNLASRSIQGHVLARLERLSDAARRFANATAVLPPGADATLAAEVAGITEAEVAGVVRALLGGYVLRDHPLDFVHPVMRSAVLEALPSVELSETHRRAATALRRRAAPPSDVALHLLYVQPSGNDEDARTLAAAGNEAAAAGAPQTAAEYLRRALAEPPEATARPAVVAALGRALAATGDETAVSVLQAAYDTAPDLGSRTDTALYLAEALYGEQDRAADAVRLLQSAAEGLAPDDDRRLGVLSRLAVFATRSGMEDVLAWCLAEIPPGLAGNTPAERACMVVQAHCAVSQDPRALLMAVVGNPEFVSGELPGSIIVGWAITVLRTLGEVRRALKLAQDAAARAQGAGRPAAVARRLAQTAMMQWRLGHLDDARATADRAVAYLEGRTAAGDWMWVDTVRVRVTLAADSVDAATEAAQHLPQGADAPKYVQLAWAELAAARGDLTLAAELFPYTEPRTPGFGPVEVEPSHRAAVWLAALGRVDEARELLERLDSHARHFSSAAAHGRLLSATGVVERDVELARSGADVLASTEFRYAHAETLVDLGMLLRRTGALKEARTVLRTGLNEARAMGAGLLARTAASELAVARGRRIDRASQGAASLTKSELRVAQRAAAGATNTQIADALFLKVKTVEMHLASAYRKLGIANRACLAQALGAAEIAGVEGELMEAEAKYRPVS